jgi:hypothetical protein
MERNISSEAAGFVNHVFSLHDTTEIQHLLSDAGFRDIAIQANDKMLNLPPSTDFLWQYIHSTPLAAVVAQADEGDLAALEREVVNVWQEFEVDGNLRYLQRIVTASARK